MVYGAQMGSIVPQGIRRKKLRYAPMVQEQARQGVATNLVAQAKENQQYKAERAFEEQQFKEQQRQFQKEHSQRKKQNDMQNMLGGVSTLIDIISLF